MYNFVVMIYFFYNDVLLCNILLCIYNDNYYVGMYIFC